MAKDKKVEQITDMDADFAQWYTDVVIKSELIDYSGVKGFYVLRPYGFAIWENIQEELDRRFKELGHENVSMPLLIPESLLQKEKDHVEGFAPECAWVTYGGAEELEERMCIRPTSETLFCDHWARTVESWRDLPKLYNQWCSVLRWEKSTRPFLRHREFLWQEGHTLHATAEEAIEETERMLEVYADVYENVLAMPVLRGLKTDKEKFAGAERTYTIECMMHDKKALQGCTSHYFGDGFARAFDITFSDRENKLSYPHQTSWGFTTRSIGGIIMTHGDNSGLALPPRIAPVQVVIVPVAAHKAGVAEKAREMQARLAGAGLRVKTDFSDRSPGWKFAEWEMKGVPLRIEIGPRDIESGECVAVRRDSGEKEAIPFERLESRAENILDDIHASLYGKAKRNLDANTYTASSVGEVREIVSGAGGGFVKTMWCGDEACEVKMKEEAGVTSRCLPLGQERVGERCPVCGRPAGKSVIWGLAY
ncbi:MAG: proline--tRNA ligase [Oscillospiraceae bacterium]|jgi:prolyl-tRNA synthetase|nr:proline--tRNA ligase [Oscillospiraceae bacterium]